jgi:hypothetical protein
MTCAACAARVQDRLNKVTASPPAARPISSSARRRYTLPFGKDQSLSRTAQARELTRPGSIMIADQDVDLARSPFELAEPPECFDVASRLGQGLA